jgi:hypothetical protein
VGGLVEHAAMSNAQQLYRPNNRHTRTSIAAHFFFFLPVLFFFFLSSLAKGHLKPFHNWNSCTNHQTIKQSVNGHADSTDIDLTIECFALQSR